FTKKLEIVGTGYRVAAKGSDLEFALGVSHPVIVKAPEGSSFTLESPTKFSVSGLSKQQVGEVAANIRKIRKPERDKGKGVRYADEVVLRNAGKAGKSPWVTHSSTPRATAAASFAHAVAVTCASAVVSSAPPSVRAWWSPVRPVTSSCRSSTTPWARPSRRPPPWRRTSAAPRRRRLTRPAPSGPWSPSAPRPPASTRSSSTAVATSTTAVWPPSLTAPARPAWRCDRRPDTGREEDLNMAAQQRSNGPAASGRRDANSSNSNARGGRQGG